MNRPMLETQPGPVSELLCNSLVTRRELGLATIYPEDDIVRRRIVAALKEVEEEVSRLIVDVTCVSTSRRH